MAINYAAFSRMYLLLSDIKIVTRYTFMYARISKPIIIILKYLKIYKQLKGTVFEYSCALV
jgi:hypothetical protein